MTVAALKPAGPPPGRAELVPKFLDPERVVTPPDNPVPPPAKLADLLESVREHGQLVPGWVCPSPDLPDEKRLCIEGNSRLAVIRMLGLASFWAFDLGRFVPEDERIRLTFNHNLIRRRMGREEIAERAARYIEITGATQAEAAKHLSVSSPTLSRCFGDRRIPPELRERADRLGLSIRSLIAALPPGLMARALEHAETPGPDGKRPTRDQVAAFNRQLAKAGKAKSRKPKLVTLRVGGRTVTLSVGEKDTASSVADDLKSIAVKLAKDHPDVRPEGWPFLFS